MLKFERHCNIMLNINIDNRASFQIKEIDNKWFIDNNEANWNTLLASNGLISILYNNKSYLATLEYIDKIKKELTIKINGQLHIVSIKEPIDQLLSSMGMDAKLTAKTETIKAPMPGLVLKILVSEGEAVSKGTGLLILEAMKMENVLKSSHDATVKSIKVTERTAVEKGTVLIELK